MHFFSHTETLFAQLQYLLEQLTPAQYTEKLPALHGSTAGQHLRHIIEFFEELNKGYASGTINYDNRQREAVVEQDKTIATEKLLCILSSVKKENKVLFLEMCYDAEPSHTETIATNYYREWAYNIEHTVHHMALIKTGLFSFHNVQLPHNFGVAASTQRAHTACAR